jgi:hypothetical protein
MTLGLAISACGQQSASPQTKPADSGPTLAATMQFIQEKLSEKGRTGWAETLSNQPGIIRRSFTQLTDVMADPAACTLYTTEATDKTIELPKGKVLKPGGPLTADDLQTHTVETDTISFKQAEKVTVEKMQNLRNEVFADAAHPDVTATVTPEVFYLKLSASNAVFSIHHSITKGTQAPVEDDKNSKFDGYIFGDEESANKVAKAMIHAMELCGGGAKKELF